MHNNRTRLSGRRPGLDTSTNFHERHTSSRSHSNVRDSEVMDHGNTEATLREGSAQGHSSRRNDRPFQRLTRRHDGREDFNSRSPFFRDGHSQHDTYQSQGSGVVRLEDPRQTSRSFNHCRMGNALAAFSMEQQGRMQLQDHSGPPIPRLKLTQLQELSLSSDSSEVILFIDRNLKPFQHSLGTCDKVPQHDQHRYIEMILRILHTICKACTDLKEAANRILAEVLSERCEQFHIQLKKYVCVTVTDKPQDIIHLFSELLRLLPSSSWKVLPVFDLVESVGLLQDSSLNQKAADLKQLFEDIRREHRKRAVVKVAKDEMTWDNSKYRDLQLYPAMEEICSEDSPRLRPSLINEPYTCWEHYYDVQFRLLREDFIAPLRRGIRECRLVEKGRRNLDIDIYDGVRILEPVFTRDGICCKIQFDISKFRRRKWEHSKRLIFGSLLCLSPKKDRFSEQVYFAIVANREPKDLEQGIVLVQFQESVELIPHCHQTVFVMAESRAYFEATRHILHSLQTAEVDTMPFTKYLVLNQSKQVEKPKYLTEDQAFYDLCWLYSGQNNKSEPKRVDILDEDAWPSEYDVELDQSQLKAIQSALKQEIAVIQGPPGTGKTYIGIKIVQTLLENRKSVGNLPILVLCYTNHALDQFLEGILDQYSLSHQLPPRIVRVGKRSQSEVIQKLNISNVKSYVPPELLREREQLTDEIEKHSKKIPWRSLKMTCQQPINEFIVGPKGVQRLKRFIARSFWDQLKCATGEEEDDHILEIWLGLWEDCIPDHTNSKAKETSERTSRLEVTKEGQASAQKLEVAPALGTSKKMPVKDQQEEAIETDELVDIEGEAATEEQARMIEDNAFQPIELDDRDVSQEEFELFSNFVFEGNAFQQVNHHKQQKKSSGKKKKHLPRKRKSDEAVKEILQKQAHSKTQMEEAEVSRLRNITTLPYHKKWALLRYWIQKYQEHVLQTNKAMFDKQTRLCKQLNDVQKEIDRYALEKAQIIGMTTTGAAKYQHILHLVKPNIVIVEEAAEVLESHIVSSLNAGTQHLILIGDHKQLRPKPNEYSLAKKHNLDVSLFERLLRNGLPHATLLIQHRMRPQIARLVCPYIYPKLENHPCVEKYQDVKGFSKTPLKFEENQNLYFYCHEEPEEEDEHLISHSNEYEADFTVALCCHLINQNYDPKQITVLTTYTGQLLKLRSKMPKKTYNGVRIVTVDNFQGEENDIIILSLVRSNRSGEVGFLKESNRVCVALSRAKMGFYCFGNFKMLRNKVPIWDTILSDMEKRSCVGSTFNIYCQNHPEKLFEVKNPRDFALFAPEGGCQDPCTCRLECGHVCTRLCHNTDREHKKVQCMKPCERLCKRKEHPCLSRCFEDCPPCQEIVTRTFEDCEHTKDVCCHQETCPILCKKLCANDLHYCKELCHVGRSCKPCKVVIPKEMPVCKHSQLVPCFKDPASVECLEKCQKQYPKCNHYVEIECCRTPNHYECCHPCEKILDCGHQCKKRCGDLCNIYDCKEEVELKLDCDHYEKVECNKVWSAKDGCHIPYLHDRITYLNDRITYLNDRDPYVQFRMCRYVPRAYPIRCTNYCSKLLPCGHKCQNKCVEKCTNECPIAVKDKWPCGHILKRKCFQTQNKMEHPCTKQCTKLLSCGHPCRKMCGEACSKTCDQLVIRDCLCGHTHKLSCSTPYDQCPCQEKCTKILKCGHTCTGKCGSCYTMRLHQPCPCKVRVDCFCGHSPELFCNGLSFTCNKKCLIGCRHSCCSHDCNIPCKAKCELPCEWNCDHFKCSQPCHAPCDRPRCNKPCSKRLPCGHHCSGVCGEPCLTVCWECSEKKFTAKLCIHRRSTFRFEANRFIELDCGHIFTVTFLDQQFQQFGKGGKICPIRCPKCLKCFRHVGRYFSQIKEKVKLIQDIAHKSLVTASENESMMDEIESNAEASSLLRFVLARRHLTKPFHILTAQNPEVVFAVTIFHFVREVSRKVSTAPAKYAMNNLARAIRSTIKTNVGRISAQFIADVEKELLLLCMLEVIESLEPDDMDADLSSDDRTRFQNAQMALKRLRNNYRSDFTREECEAYLSPLAQLYLFKTGKNISDLIPSLPSPSIATKGEWYKCPVGHVYFHPACLAKKAETPHCPDCISK